MIESTNRCTFDPPLRFLADDGTLSSGAPEVSGEDLLRVYRSMQTARMLDDRLTRLQRQGRIGFNIGGPGEEAAVLGAAHALEPEDWLFPSYRETAALLHRDVPLGSIVDGMFCNARDVSRGRQMPGHPTGRARRFVSVSSPLGTQIPQAVGAAYAAALRRDPVVALTFFGEGTTSEGNFHVAMNFAGVFRAPAIFLCRNNQWAISVPRSRQTASGTIAQKAVAYGVFGMQVDGNDFFAVYAATREARVRALEGQGPTLIEAVTYRLGAHSTSDDPNAYRDKDEVEKWKARDPILRTRRRLERLGLWDDARQQALEAELDAGIREAVESAEAAPRPPLESIVTDVYADVPWHLREQLAEVTPFHVEGHGDG